MSIAPAPGWAFSSRFPCPASASAEIKVAASKPRSKSPSNSRSLLEAQGWNSFKGDNSGDRSELHRNSKFSTALAALSLAAATSTLTTVRRFSGRQARKRAWIRSNSSLTVSSTGEFLASTASSSSFCSSSLIRPLEVRGVALYARLDDPQVRMQGSGEIRRNPDDYLSVREIYQYLKEAPNVIKAMKLAARFRMASREGRKMKDGRKLDPGDIDKAMDAVLENVERKKAPLRPEPVDQVPYDDDDEGPVSPFAKTASQFSPQQAQQDQEYGDYGEDEPDEDQSYRLRAERAARRAADARARWSLPNAYDEDDDHVPKELWEEVISRKRNVVDRVWRAPTAGSLPKVPRRIPGEKIAPSENWLRLPHIVTNGMTNSGKSRLICHLINWDFAAKVSSKAGKTDSIDFYCINNRFVLVDLPGYPDPTEVAHLGVLKTWEAKWEELVHAYLDLCVQKRYDLRLLLHLQQTNKRPTKNCMLFVSKAKSMNLPLLPLLTKDDQITKQNKGGHEQRKKYAKLIRSVLNITGPHIHYSADNSVPLGRKGKYNVHRWIRNAINAKSGSEVVQMLDKAGECFKERNPGQQSAEQAAPVTTAPTEQSTEQAAPVQDSIEQAAPAQDSIEQANAAEPEPKPEVDKAKAEERQRRLEQQRRRRELKQRRSEVLKKEGRPDY
eukprot:TRINITY_DN79122_c0_g1_i1.p1 TRINITY_DN79122_c0_g1~~TRINITY_DN79122_c0_g1_i1.p1  ORF type:complete len:677 (-),score=104.88 TRINITY_DN79122_c0_g1_i1:143-2149(-)